MIHLPSWLRPGSWPSVEHADQTFPCTPPAMASWHHGGFPIYPLVI